MAIERLQASPSIAPRPQQAMTPMPQPSRRQRQQDRPIPTRPLAPFEARPRVSESSATFPNPQPAETKPPPKAYVWDPIRGGFVDDLAREDEAKRLAAQWGAHWGAAIRAARERRGWSQTDLGAEIGKTSMSVSLYEREKVRPSAQAREKLLRVLGVTVPA
jgi:ribosome-binding protein aMBF1 (putative translation factor)